MLPTLQRHSRLAKGQQGINSASVASIAKCPWPKVAIPREIISHVEKRHIEARPVRPDPITLVAAPEIIELVQRLFQPSGFSEQVIAGFLGAAAFAVVVMSFRRSLPLGAR